MFISCALYCTCLHYLWISAESDRIWNRYPSGHIHNRIWIFGYGYMAPFWKKKFPAQICFAADHDWKNKSDVFRLASVTNICVFNDLRNESYVREENAYSVWSRSYHSLVWSWSSIHSRTKVSHEAAQNRHYPCVRVCKDNVCTALPRALTFHAPMILQVCWSAP